MRPSIILFTAVVCAAWVGLALASWGHQAPSGWQYPGRCCSGTDCAPVAPDGIRCTAEGCTITIVPGTHPMVPAGTNGGHPIEIRTTKQPEISPDGQNHACISRTLHVYCVFMGGSV